MTHSWKIPLYGQTLIIDNANLTSACERFWQGIIVRGDRLNTTQSPLTHGSLEIYSGLIENAKIAVEVADEYQYHGGIVKAENSTFKNCRKFVGFGSYPGVNNRSYFYNCTFLCEGPLIDGLYWSKGTKEFVSLWQVDGIEFRGNTFKNTGDYYHYSDEYRGCGIYSIDAGFIVARTYLTPPQTNCDPPDGIGNHFEGLSVGIYCEQTSGSNSIKILENTFLNCDIGIEANKGYDLQVYGNDLTYNNDFYNYKGNERTLPGTPIGIITDQSERFEILENHITWTIDVSGLAEFTGIYTRKSDPNFDSRIYDNQITNNSSAKNTVGDYLEDNNDKLAVHCNDYTTNTYYDWYVKTGATLQDQGEPGNGAGNVFSATACSPDPFTDFKQISNNGMTFSYISSISLLPSCFDNVNLINTSIDDCPAITKDYIYCEDQTGGGGDEGGFIEYSVLPEDKDINANIFSNIYNGNFEQANLLIQEYSNSSVADNNMITLFNIVNNIYQDNRNYSSMDSIETSEFFKLAKNNDNASQYAKNILYLFKADLYPPRLLYFPNSETIDKRSIDHTVDISNIKLNIYPNPTDNSFTVYYELYEEGAEGTISFYNIEGKIVKQLFVTQLSDKIVLSKDDLGKTGMYNCILRLNDNDYKIEKILIIE